MQKIEILFDHQTFTTQRYGGISRYFYEIIRNMDGADSKVALWFSENAYIRKKDITQYCSFIPHAIFKAFKGTFRNINRYNSRHKIAHSQRLFHPTYYDPYFLQYMAGKKYVLTIHDMIHERFPEYFSADDKTATSKKVLAENATRIIAISEQTKKDIIDILHIDAGKIDVIYHGITPHECSYDRLQLPDSYLLFVGERKGYKNFDRLVAAFKLLKRSHPHLKLVCTGKPFKKAEQARLQETGVEDDIIYINANDDELSQLYHNAEMLVYPSLYEGFGIPILEAYSFHCPVALSNASCFPEIAGEAGEFFDPLSVDSIVQAIGSILDNSGLRQHLVSLGNERIKRYTWAETARLTELTYRKALGLD